MRQGLAASFTVVAFVVEGVTLPSSSQAFGTEVPFAAGACAKGPLRSPRANCAPSPPPSTGDAHEDCVARINQLRWRCQCLPPLKRWKAGEKCARKHAKHDMKKGIHTGFNDRICKPQGLAQNECPGWPTIEGTISGCFQAMWDEGPGKRFSKHGHYINMSSLEYEEVACGFAKTGDGEVWSVQNFR